MAISHQEQDTNTVSLGFWLYLMTDCLLFATLFATYAVLHNNTAGSVAGKDIFEMNYVLVQTIALLASSVTSGFALITARAKKYTASMLWLFGTILLGALFLGLEINEFQNLASEGHSWATSAFLSSFFTLVGTHGAHITVGLIWALLLLVVMVTRGVNDRFIKKMTLFTMFWHFLDIIWIFIFTLVYAVGSVG
jgi:cytochrome o ubiquinol oxidase subunit 3